MNGTFVLSHANGMGGTPTWSLLGVTNAACSPFAQAGSCTGANARLDHSSIYDAVSGRMVSFGGHFEFFGTGQNGPRVLTDANGLVAPSTWVPLAPSGAPPGVRGNHTAVYDTASNRMIVFGGWDVINPGSYYNDLWILENANGLSVSSWLLETPLGTPPSPRSEQSAVYADRLLTERRSKGPTRFVSFRSVGKE